VKKAIPRHGVLPRRFHSFPHASFLPPPPRAARNDDAEKDLDRKIFDRYRKAMVADRFAIDLNGSRIVVTIDILGNILPPPPEETR